MCYSLGRVYITGPEIKLAERVKNYRSLFVSCKSGSRHLPAPNFILDPESKEVVLSLEFRAVSEPFPDDGRVLYLLPHDGHWPQVAMSMTHSLRGLRSGTANCI